MPSLNSLARALAILGSAASASPFQPLAPRFGAQQRDLPVCHLTTPFYCPLNAATATDIRFNYDSLSFAPIPPGTTGNPATNTFCVSKDCTVSGSITIAIEGNSCDSIGTSDPVVVIEFPALTGYTYQEEHIYVGPTGVTPETRPGQMTFTGIEYCTEVGTQPTCTIPLSLFLSKAGITSICTDDAPHSFLIVTHASLKDSSGKGITGTSKGTCINADCSPWFAYGTITVQCKKCTLCTDCPCPAYAAANKCKCDQAYANANPCECYPNTCKCSTYADAHPCECFANTCKCSDYADAHPCECYPNTCKCSTYAGANLCECFPNTCKCPTYADANPCDCYKDTCKCSTYADANPCECFADTCKCGMYADAHPCDCFANTCKCSTYADANPCECYANTCQCGTYADANPCECFANTCKCGIYGDANPCECFPSTCKCPTYATGHVCECNPTCDCPGYATAHPDQCFKWCPDADTAYGYFGDPVPKWQAQFNAKNAYGAALSNKNCQSKWGWWDTFVAAEVVDGKSYSGRMVAGAGNYNLAAATTVGTFTLSFAGGKAYFSFTTSSPSLQFDALHIQAGCAVPSTCAPGQFDNTFVRVPGGSGPDSGASGTNLALSLPSGCSLTSQYVYFIFHGAVAKKVPISQSCGAAVPQ